LRIRPVRAFQELLARAEIVAPEDAMAAILVPSRRAGNRMRE